VKHHIVCDRSLNAHGDLTGQPSCTCGWTGAQFDIGEFSERKRYDNEVLGHRLTVGVARGCMAMLVLVGLSWLALMLLGAVAVVRWVGDVA
jgi:hypothetical protein